MTKTPLVGATVLRALLVMMAALVAYKTFTFATRGPDGALFEIDSFQISGRLALAGKMHEAYAWKTLRPYFGNSGFMPWTYPPPFNLVVAPLALVPIAWAYVLFMLATFAAFVAVLRRLAGQDLPQVFVSTFPAMLITASCGQNGFLLGALIGLAAIWLIEGRGRAGVPLGLMVVKPHLVVPLALEVLLSLRWKAIGIALATALAACLAATLAFGGSIWPAFLNGVAEAKAFLDSGSYPLYRMVSIYAAVKSLNVSTVAAIAATAILAVLMLAMVVRAHYSALSPRDAIGVAVLASPFISPYAYDYDLCLMTVALALLMPTLKRRLSERAQLALMLLAIAGSGAGLVQHQRAEMGAIDADTAISFGVFPLLAAVAVIWVALRREMTRSAPASPPLDGLQPAG